MNHHIRNPSFEFREVVQPEGGLELELYVEGLRISNARARADALADMQEVLGVKRADVRALLETVLVEQFERKWEMIDLASPRPAVTKRGGRFFSRYVHRDSEGTTAGIVWCDSGSSTTGPEHVPAVVRSKMRLAVQYKLAQQRRGPLGFLVDILHGMAE